MGMVAAPDDCYLLAAHLYGQQSRRWFAASTSFAARDFPQPCPADGHHDGGVTDAPKFRLWPPAALGVPLLAGVIATATTGDPLT